MSDQARPLSFGQEHFRGRVKWQAALSAIAKNRVLASVRPNWEHLQ